MPSKICFRRAAASSSVGVGVVASPSSTAGPTAGPAPSAWVGAAEVHCGALRYLIRAKGSRLSMCVNRCSERPAADSWRPGTRGCQQMDVATDPLHSQRVRRCARPAHQSAAAATAPPTAIAAATSWGPRICLKRPRLPPPPPPPPSPAPARPGESVATSRVGRAQLAAPIVSQPARRPIRLATSIISF